MTSTVFCGTRMEHGGSVRKSELARRQQMRLNELDVVLQELERVGKIKLTEIRGKLVVRLREADDIIRGRGQKERMSRRFWK